MSVGCQHSAGVDTEHTFAIRVTVARAGGYGERVLGEDEDFTEATGETVDDAVPGAVEPIEGHADAGIHRFARSSLGTVFAAGLFGLRDALEPPKDETPAIVEDWAGGEPFADPIVLRLDPDHPEDSIVMIRSTRRRADDPPST